MSSGGTDYPAATNRRVSAQLRGADQSLAGREGLHLLYAGANDPDSQLVFAGFFRPVVGEATVSLVFGLIVTSTVAGRSAWKWRAKCISASIPPADVPMAI
jgi:hypothetical protein